MITNDTETFYKNMEIHDKRKIVKLEKEIEELKEQLDLYKSVIDKAIKYVEENGSGNLKITFGKFLLEILEDNLYKG